MYETATTTAVYSSHNDDDDDDNDAWNTSEKWHLSLLHFTEKQTITGSSEHNEALHMTRNKRLQVNYLCGKIS